MQSPLLGFNNNVKHRGRLFHIQTEDSGVRHPHVITHLFMDGGRILKTVKTSYAQHVGTEKLADLVRSLMKEQHKMMFIALRDGQFDYVLDPDEPAPVSRAGGNSTPRVGFQPTPAPPAGDAPGLVKGVAVPPVQVAKDSAAGGARSNQRREAPEFFAGPGADAAKVDVVPPSAEEAARPAVKPPTVAPPTKKEGRDRQSSGRYVASRPAAIFTAGRAPEAGGSIFGDDLISEKSLDEVILSYLSEDLDGATTKK